MKMNIHKIKYLLAFMIFGTVGIVAHFVNVSPGFMILCRSILGVITIGIYLLITRKRIDKNSVKNNFLWLVLCGLCLGGNWICLFTSYTKTTVAIGSLCNNIAPAVFILIAPLFFKEKLTLKKIICAILVLCGLVFISGVFESNITGISDFYGVLLGLGAALCYVGFLIFNKKITNINPMDKVIFELLFAIVAILPYALLTTDFSSIVINVHFVGILLVMGIVHTGIAYVLYLGQMEYLDSQTIAIYSYAEPILAVVLSYFVLQEAMTIFTLIGAILIIGATFVSEVEFKKRQKVLE